MSEAIPLRPALGIQRVQVIVSYAFFQRFDFMLELLAMESWDFWNMQRKAIVPLSLVNVQMLSSDKLRTLVKSSAQS